MRLHKLSNLPYLALVIIFEHMDPINLFNLSLISKRLMTAISMYRLKSAVCNIKLRTTFRGEISIQITFPSQFVLTWKFAAVHDARRMAIDGPTFPLVIQGTTLESCARHTESNTIYTFGPSLDASLKLVTEYLFDLFACNIHQIDMDQHVFSEMPLYSEFLKTNKCELLTLRANESTSKENVEEILDCFKTTKTVDIGCYEGGEVDVRKLENLDKVRLNDALWMSSESFLKLNCKRIEIGESRLDGVDMNTFINQWQRGEKENLVALSVGYEDRSEMDATDVLSGIQLETWNKKKRHRYYRLGQNLAYDCCHGLDFLSDSGKMGTVLFEKHQLHFFVWHERFPDFTLPPGQYFTKTPRIALLEARYPVPSVFQFVRETLWDQECRVEL